ncbi:UNVERIFIED_CONTAM: hypothetical protein GTU68_062061 [Idotea baltica]|nr:hypothetical protein [Idotea baltica]
MYAIIILLNQYIGQLLVRQVNGKRLSGFITETECYLGTADSASHTFNGKKTRRNEPMFMEPGTSYVYSIYGMYFCFNISSKEVGSCVLIRSLEPYEGIEEMHVYRHKHRKASSKELKTHQLCNGPSKLCQALNISKNCNKINMAESDEFWVENGSEYASEENIVVSKRIGIESAGEEAASKPLRFYLKNNPSVSVRDRKAEQEMAG